MQIRKLVLDFKRSLPHWNPSEPEFSQINNAASTVLPHLEPYLIKVLRLALKQLESGKDDKLKNDIDLFISQEANHYRVHQSYNKTLYANGYPELKEYEQKLADDYKEFLANRSLEFNLAYSEGFESLGIIQAEFMFNHAGKWLADADPSVRTLWEWHLAEEYEHRRVCYDIFKRIHGGYFYRVYGLFYAVRHLGGYGRRVSKFLIRKDRELGLVDSSRKSRWREAQYRFHLGLFSAVKILRILSPFYNPGRLKMLPAAQQRLNNLSLAS